MNFKIALIQPEIPQNTGNIGRLAVALGVELILVGKLGFSLDEKAIRRAGMDYWFQLKFCRMELELFLREITPNSAFISTKGSALYTDLSHDTDLLVFGNESSGFPEIFYEKYPKQLYKIPMKEGVRSINLATSVGVTAYHLAYKKNFTGL